MKSLKMKTRYAVKPACSNALSYESDVITDAMRQHLRVNPTASLIRRSKSREAQGAGFVYVKLP